MSKTTTHTAHKPQRSHDDAVVEMLRNDPNCDGAGY